MPAIAPASRPASPDEEGPISLARTPIGWRRRVVTIEEPARTALEPEGLRPGAIIVVTARTPLGGPVVVELGHARIALPAGVAALVGTAPLATAVEPG